MSNIEYWILNVEVKKVRDSTLNIRYSTFDI